MGISEKLGFHPGRTSLALATALTVAGCSDQAEVLRLESGNRQVGRVGEPLPAPPVVKAATAGGGGVKSVPVKWELRSGDGSLSAESVLTDANGLAQVTWTLGTAVGEDTVSASVVGLAGSPVLFTATAIPGVASSLTFSSQPGRAIVGVPLAPAIEVTAWDRYGHVATGLTEAITMALAENPAGASVGGTAGVVPSDGVARFTALHVDKRGAGFRLVATVTPGGGSLITATSNAFEALEVDQQQPVFDAAADFVWGIGGSSEQKLAQVFTAGLSGALVEVSMPVACSSDLQLEIQEVTGDVPNGVVRASQNVSREELPPFLNMAPVVFRTLRITNAPAISAGEKLAMVLSTSTTGGCGLHPGPVGDPYGPGDAFFDARPNPPGWLPMSGGRYDLPFKTLVR